MTWTFVDNPNQEVQEQPEAQTQASPPQSVLSKDHPYYVEEKTPDQLKQMSLSEKMQYIQDSNRQREYLQSAGFVKGALSGLTFGGSQQLEPLKIQEEEKMPLNWNVVAGELAGSYLPISGLFKLAGVAGAPLVNLANKSPIFQKQLTSFFNLTGDITKAAVAGAGYGAAEKLVQGEMPTSDDMLEHGYMWAILDASLKLTGKTGQFVYNLANKAKASRRPPYKILNNISEELKGTPSGQVAEKALEILEKEPAIALKELETRAIEPSGFDKLTKRIEEISEPLPPVEEFNFEKISKELPDSLPESELDVIAKRAESNKELGEGIQNDIQTSFEEASNSYEPLYRQVEEAAEGITYKPRRTLKLVEDTLKDIRSLKTKPEGYQKVISSLEDILEDIGRKRVTTKGFEGMTLDMEIPVKDLMELGRRVNKIIDYDIVGSHIKNRLKPVARMVKEEIRDALRTKNPELAEIFNIAENQYGRTAEKFGKESVMKIRGEVIPEKISSLLTSPTAVEELRQILSTNQMAQVEREILEKMNKMPLNKAKEFSRNIDKQLSPESREIARDIVKTKEPISPRTSEEVLRNKVKDSVLDDLWKSLNTGERPSKTLKFMKTPKGQKMVENALRDNPNYGQVMDYLKKQNNYDYISSLVKNGKLDFQQLKQFLKDPAFLENIKRTGGPDTLTFLKNLENLSKNVDRNLKILEKFPAKEISKGERGKEILKRMARTEQPLKFGFEQALEGLDIPMKSALWVMGYLSFGLPKTAIAGYGLKLLYKFITNQATRTAFRKAAVKKINPQSFIQALELFKSSMEEEESEEEGEGGWVLQ